MATDITTTLTGVSVLNRPGQPFGYWVEGRSIIGRWLWQDQTLIAPGAVTDEMREYQFICDLNDDGTYKEHTKEFTSSSGVFVRGGSVGFGFGKSAFSGNSAGKSISASLGRDKQTGQVGVVIAQFDSDWIKRPLRDYLAAQGWRAKGGLFSRR